MRINPKMIAIPRGPKKEVKPPDAELLGEFATPLEGILFDELDGEEIGVPGN